MKHFKVIKIITGFFLLFLLQSCFVAKEYRQPETETQNLYRSTLQGAKGNGVSDSISIANISWKDMFSDTLLKGYIAKGLSNNLDIRIALQHIASAAAYVKQGKAGNWPSINANLDYSYTDNSKNSQLGSIFSGAINQYDLSASLSWEADIWGKIRSQKRAALATYLQSVEAHKAVKTRLIAAIAATYYQLMALDEQMQIAEASVQARDSSLETTKALMQAGQLTAVAVKQTEAQVYAAQLILINLQQQERLLENSFCMLMGEPAHSIVRGSLEQQQINTPLKTGVPALLLSNRPDVMAAEDAYRNAFELTNVAKSNFYPSLTITAAAGFESIDIKNWLSFNSIFSNIAGDLLQPVFNRRRIKTAYEVAQAQQQEALLNYQKALLTAGNEVSNALFKYQSETRIIDLEEKQYAAYKVAVDYSEQLLNNGLANYLEVLTARQNALSSKLSLVDARYEQLNAIITLYEALGGGWK
jgi:NodT family efflux transporter outer membrane factor (OMF) lipoprotein